MVQLSHAPSSSLGATPAGSPIAAVGAPASLLACTPSPDIAQLPPTVSDRHTCHVCGKTFGQPYNLKRHLTTHTGERKFQCPHCAYRATQNAHLDKHIRRIHPLCNNNQTGGNQVKNEAAKSSDSSKLSTMTWIPLSATQ